MHVVFVSHSSSLYGAERSLLDLVLGVRILGVQPTVILPKYGVLAEELERNNVSYIIHSYYGWLGRNHRIVKGLYRFTFNRLSVLGLIKILKKANVDLVYTNTITTPIGAIIAKALGVSHVWHIREFMQKGMDSGFDFGIHHARRFIKKNSSQIIFNSYALKEQLSPLIRGVPGAVVYNGWLIGEPSCITSKKILSSREPMNLCIVGSLTYNKGQHVAIEALSILKQEFPHIALDIVGAGDSSYGRELKELSVARHVSSSVTWRGFTSSITDVFKRSDIALVCSFYEAFGRVVVEAMAEGCPVVASNTGGIPEIIKHGENGLMYNCGSAEDLARQVSVLINDQALYAKIMREARADVYKRFTRNKYAKQIYHIMKSL